MIITLEYDFITGEPYYLARSHSATRTILAEGRTREEAANAAFEMIIADSLTIEGPL